MQWLNYRLLTVSCVTWMAMACSGGKKSKSTASDAAGETPTVVSSVASDETSTSSGGGVTSISTVVSGGATTTDNTTSSSVSTLTASSASIAVGSTQALSLTVVLKDASGTAVAGKTVSLTSSRGNTDTITPATATSAADGSVIFSVSSLTVGSATFTAKDMTSDVTLAQTLAINFTEGAISPALSTVVASPTSITADGSTTSTITVTLNRSTGVVAGKTVTLTSSRGSSDSIAPASATSNGSGVATFTVTSTVAGSATFTAVDTTDSISITQTAAVTYVPGAVTAAQSTVSTSTGSVVANGSSTATITVTLKDANNNAVSGKTVTLSSSRNATDSIAPASGTSNASGVVTFSVSSTTSGNATFSAVGDSVSITQTAAVGFIAGPVSAAQSTVSAGTASLTANGSSTSTITVTLKDAYGNNVPNQNVSLSSSRTTNDTISAASGASTSGGVVTFTVSSTHAGTGIFTASSGGTSITQTASVTFTAGSFSAAVSTVSSAGNTVADGTSFTTITVTIKDAYGNGISGKTVTLDTSRNGIDTISAASGTSSGSGIVTFTVSSSTVGSSTFTATNVTDSNTTITQTATVNFNNILTAFPYRQTLSISLASGADTPTDYQVLVHFDQGSVGPGFNWANQCSDVRFSTTGGTELSHWVESCTTTNAAAAKIWVKIPSAISTSGMSIYMYYGNSNYANTSSGTATFDIFDNFSAGSLNTGMWSSIASTNGSIGQSSGNLNLNCSNTCDWWDNNSDGVRVWQPFSGNYVFQTVVTDSINDTHTIGLFIDNDPTTPDAAARIIALAKNNNIHYVTAERLGFGFASALSVANRYFLRIRYSGTVFFEYSKDGIRWYEIYNEATTASKIGLMAKTWAGASVSTAFEYFFARKFNAVEPTVTMGTTAGYTAPTLAAWSYKMPVTVSLASGSASPAGYQVLLKLNSGNVGAHFNWGLACTDLRFRDSLGAELSYWIESCAASTARIWVKMNSAITTTGEQITMYYSNASATIASDGWRTFESFDDFEAASLHTSYWGSANLSGTFSQTGGALVANCASDCDWFGGFFHVNAGARIWRHYSGEVVIQTAVTANNSGGSMHAGLLVSNLPLGLAGDNRYLAYYKNGATLEIHDANAGDTSQPATATASAAKYYLRARATASTMYFDYSSDADTWTTNFSSFSGTKSYFGLMLKSWGSSSNATASFDYIFVRKYHTLEPTVAFGSETTN